MRIRMNRRRWTALAVVASVGLLLTILSASPTPPAEPPLQGCFDKALSDDPMICYILEQAQEEEIIEVAAIYRADDDLHYVYLTQTEPVGDKVGEFFRDKVEEFIDSWPEIALKEPYPDYVAGCMRERWIRKYPGHDYKSCLLDATHWKGDTLLPYSVSYGAILVRTGGTDGKRSERAWASFRQVWPAAVTPDTSGAFDMSDVDLTNFPEFKTERWCRGGPVELIDSDGKVTVLEVLDVVCDEEQLKAKADVAAFTVEYGGSTFYVQYKDPPEGEEELEALKDTLIPPCFRSYLCTRMEDTTTGKVEVTVIATVVSDKPGTPVKLHGPLADATPFTIVDDLDATPATLHSGDLGDYHDELNRLLDATHPDPTSVKVSFTYIEHNYPDLGTVAEVEIIPVKYNYTDLRRYETILNRFVHSRGNTIGILGAELRDNDLRSYHYDNLLWPPDGPGEAGEDEERQAYKPAELRSTIVVTAFDSQRVLNALPKLLPALGIPAEAVGAVHEKRIKPHFGLLFTLIDPCDIDPLECLRQPAPVLHQFLAAVGVPHWMPLWASYTVLGIVVLGIISSTVFMTYRLLTRLARFMRLRRA